MKTVSLIRHSKAMECLLKTWCDITIKELDKKSEDKTIEMKIKFKDKNIKINNIENCMIFKLEFEDNQLINIELV